MPPVLQTVELGPLCVRAMVAPSSVDDTARTVDLIFSTGAAVDRYDWMSGKRYVEKLSMDPAAIRLDRLNAGAPLLDSHSAYSVRDQLGAVVPNTAKVIGKQARATVQFSRRDEVEPIWQDVRDGLLRNVSVGYRVYKYEETAGKGDAPSVRVAMDWEPYEISMVPMPADAGAQTRGAKPASEMNHCEIVTRGVAATIEEPVMPEDIQQTEETRSEFITEQPPAPPAQGTRAADPPAEPNDRDLGVKAERIRVNGIRLACTAGRMTRGFEQKLVDDGVSLVDAQTRVFEELKKQDPQHIQGQTRAEVSGDSPFVHERAGIENALMNRVAPALFPLDEKGRQYRGMTMLGIAEVFLKARGIRTTSMSKSDIAGVALGLNQRGSGYQTTSDFPELLADVANKTLQKAYAEAPQTWQLFSRQISAGDFKNINMMQFGDAPAMLEVKEHGEFQRGTIVDSKETFALKTYGRIFAVTRQALINDDIDAFSRVPTQFGRQARVLESDLVYAQITGNPTMGDGNALFSAAHANLETDGDHIAIASLDRARQSVRRQRSLDGVTRLNLTPKYLLVPTTLETKAQQYVGPITPQTAANANPFSGLLQVVPEPRLDDNSVIAWYMLASNDQLDIVVYAYLEGQTGPTIEQRIGFDIDGLEIKARHDFAAKVVDWRGIHKDPGDLDT